MKERPAKVISCCFGGLGDWLLVSTLARRFAEVRTDEAPEGYEVFIHDGILAPFRNSEIKALVLGNPHLSKKTGGVSTTPGMSTLPPNAGHGVYVDLWGRFCWEARMRSADPIAIMEMINDLPPPYSHAPEIYVDLPPVAVNDSIILVDPYSSSVPFTTDSVNPWVEYYKGHYEGKTFYCLETPGYAAFHRSLFGFPKINANSLAEYIGLLRSVHAFFGVESGGQMLAAAVKNSIRPELRVHALFSTRGYNQKFYRLHEAFVQTDVSGFVIQNDFAVDPGELGYRHIVQTGQFALKTNAAEQEKPPEPLTAKKLLEVPNSPQAIEGMYIPSNGKTYHDVGDGFPTEMTEASM